MKRGKQTIFFVDDEPGIRAVVADALSKSGFHVSCFADAAECLKGLNRSDCNLLVTDLRMPGLDGMALLTRARHIAPWMPVIIVTGYADVPVAVRAMKLGAVDFIQKPLDRKAFINKVRTVLDESGPGELACVQTLTKTEKRILMMVLEGKGSKGIAYKMGRAVRTVEFHRTNIMRKFGVSSVVDLVKKALPVMRPQED